MAEDWFDRFHFFFFNFKTDDLQNILFKEAKFSLVCLLMPFLRMFLSVGDRNTLCSAPVFPMLKHINMKFYMLLFF